MSIDDLGIFEVILFALSYLIITIVLMYLSGDHYADEKQPWWSRWTRWK
ncbi:MAG: hypothetical protein KKB51_05440 [Candidatus Riflebacteria bacterium]|nr:hypothetical protein [Candidatus Riflebacteria bacterium]